MGRRLRRQGLTGATVTLKLKYSYGSGRSAQRRLPHPTDDENIFVAVALELLDNIWQEGMHVRLAGIGMSDFDHQGGIQTDLFCEIDDRGAQSSDRRDLSVAIDAVRDKFGDSAFPSAANHASITSLFWTGGLLPSARHGIGSQFGTGLF